MNGARRCRTSSAPSKTIKSPGKRAWPGAPQRSGRDFTRCSRVYWGRIQISSSTLTEDVYVLRSEDYQKSRKARLARSAAALRAGLHTMQPGLLGAHPDIL